MVMDYTVDCHLTINWIRNKPTSAKDMIKKINVILDHFSGIIKQKGTIFYIYIVTALHASHTIRSDYAVYDGEIKGVYQFSYPLPLVEGKIECSMNFSDTEFNPDITIYFDLKIKRSKRVGVPFEVNIEEGNKGKLSGKQIIRLLKNHYNVNARLQGTGIIIQESD